VALDNIFHQKTNKDGRKERQEEKLSNGKWLITGTDDTK
jgi:hypothetical protein